MENSRISIMITLGQAHITQKIPVGGKETIKILALVPQSVMILLRILKQQHLNYQIQDLELIVIKKALANHKIVEDLRQVVKLHQHVKSVYIIRSICFHQDQECTLHHRAHLLSLTVQM